jgi:hypothetical protein
MDYLPFERITYRKPEITSIEESVWIWFIWSSSPLVTGASAGSVLYTIPTGYKAVISDIIVSSEYMGETKFWIPGGDNIFWSYHEPYEPSHHSFVLPPVANEGEEIDLQTWNRDTVSGNYRFVLSMWQVPGSKPEKPKKDDPAERFKVGDFSSANVIFLPDGETLYLFHKRMEDKDNYLRFKDYGRRSEKKLVSFHLMPEHADEIMSTLRASPQKVKEVLAKYEEKYGKAKKFWPF